MVQPRPLYLRVEFDEEKVEALGKAMERFDDAHAELRASAAALQDTMYDLKNSMAVRKEVLDEDPGVSDRETGL